MKHLIQTLSPQVAPTYWNVNARTPLGHQFTRSDVGEYHLLFGKKLHEIIYTKDKITDEDGGSVQIKLIVPITGGIIEEIGGLSSVEIEIVVLEGDFGSDSHENWTEKEFNDKIVPQRGHKPLVKEKQNITLRDGVGSIGDLKFSVNSRRTSCKKFRLGARVLQSSSNMVQVRIKEAVSDAFTVRDQRGKMKHLEKIQEGGKFHKALIDNHICSGSELKQMYKTDPGKLMMILKGCSKWEWEVIVNHASCVLDDANSNPSRSQEAEANNTLTTGSTGMPNNSNRASSSQCLAENLPNSASQPLDMPNPHSNTNYAPLILSNDSHQPLNNDYGDPRWYSPYLLPSNDNHMTESYQINNNGLDDTFFYST
ncbi:hypothetical protein Ddye_026043 [Dipteronia dyeriana]|uniref:Uncharacterized protein n=1 Tax=Dipteronia dyeriana TaxID=168575 RepID=A0AAD9TLW9_9ROSI|nr:hypothetical protein Ddye_026043 [Dipteronia dyeriana]